MEIILDTNALLWLLSSNEQKTKLGKVAQGAIDLADTVYVSSASILELRIKEMLGKIKLPANLFDVIKKSGLIFLPITAEHADALTNFKSLSRHDPFDSILLAQADCEMAMLLTADTFLLKSQPQLTVSAKK